MHGFLNLHFVSTSVCFNPTKHENIDLNMLKLIFAKICELDFFRRKQEIEMNTIDT